MYPNSIYFGPKVPKYLNGDYFKARVYEKRIHGLLG